MSIISYAQNFEDVMLWRALGHINKGCYLDIGAQDPIKDSVSKAFHDAGWQGIHVEPVTNYVEELREQRPGDLVVQAAVGSRPGNLCFYEVPGTGLSTGNLAIAKKYQKEGHQLRETSVEQITLDQLFDKVRSPEIHWLKIDVEGMEAEVIGGWVNSTLRPWIVVVESTRPGSKEESSLAWHERLQEKGYQPVYFDGINRFYISQEHPELEAAFDAPPNVFDEFVLSGQASQSFCQRVQNETWQANERALVLSKELDEARHQNTLAELKIAELEASNESVRQELNIVLQSRSWRMTRPLRQAASKTRIVGSRYGGRVGSALDGRRYRRLLKGKLNALLYRASRTIARSPKLKCMALRVLKHSPRLHQRLVSQVQRGALTSRGNSGPYALVASEHLTPRQQALKAQLEQAIARNKPQE